MEFLKTNAVDDELVIYGGGEYSYIYSQLVPENALLPLNKPDLLGWGCNPFSSAASYVWGGGREDVWIENTLLTSSKTLDQGQQLIFGREFEGKNGNDRFYFEVSQEFAHLESIHWQREHSSYCRFDNNGELEHVVSITKRDRQDISLVSCLWEPLETYLVTSKQVLVRLFDFTLLDRSAFRDWGPNAETIFDELDDFFYRQKINGDAAYTRGVQIIRPRRPSIEVFNNIKGDSSNTHEDNYCEFIAKDWRNGTLSKISTDPRSTTNYFDAKNNNLPFELSPAFFKPEVLLKYKADKDKFTLGERDLTCRAAWHLKGFDVNEAGQVFAYICDLRNLPYNEQLYWLSYNEPPKAPISQRALANDFKGEWSDQICPLQQIIGLARSWSQENLEWWILGDDTLLDRVNVPLTSSKDEWAEAFLDLAKLIIEGFSYKELRKLLDIAEANYEKEERSISLLRKLVNKIHGANQSYQLEGLREVQYIRSKVKGHRESNRTLLAEEAISKHGSFTDHFRNICEKVFDEMELIQSAIAQLK